MWTTIVSLLGGGIGGLMRLVPELLKFVETREENKHELKMTQLQIELEKTKAQMQVQVAEAQAQAQIGVSDAQGFMQQLTLQMQAYIEAIRVQGQMTGIKWLDGLNQSVRPVLTYWWMVLFTVWKLDSIYRYGLTWSNDDWGVLSMILGFWFVDRAIRRNSGK